MKHLSAQQGTAARDGLFLVKELSRLLFEAVLDGREIEMHIKAGTEPFEPVVAGSLQKRLDGSCEFHVSIKKRSSSKSDLQEPPPC